MRILMLAAAIAAPVTAAPLGQRLKALPGEEYVFQAVNAADAFTTIRALDKPGSYERNFMLGKHPSHGAIIGQKTAIGALHIAGTMWLQDHAPRLVRPWEIIGITVVGKAVVGNIKVRF